jgi:hypothetical protein
VDEKDDEKDPEPDPMEVDEEEEDDDMDLTNSLLLLLLLLLDTLTLTPAGVVAVVAVVAVAVPVAVTVVVVVVVPSATALDALILCIIIATKVENSMCSSSPSGSTSRIICCSAASLTEWLWPRDFTAMASSADEMAPLPSLSKIVKACLKPFNCFSVSE